MVNCKNADGENRENCKASVMAVRDALDALNGKWKLPLIHALFEGPKRFNEIQRALVDITPKILSKELRELEMNQFVERKVFKTRPVTVLYELTPYSGSLEKLLNELKAWGLEHRRKIMKTPELKPAVVETEGAEKMGIKTPRVEEVAA